MTSPAWMDWLALAASVAMVVAYRGYVRLRGRRDPHYDLPSLNAVARRHWVQEIMARPGKEILAVQTLRNSVMAATFMASTAVILIMGTLTLAAEADRLHGAWRALLAVDPAHRDVRAINLLLLLCDFFVAFFCFSIAIRLFNHVGYMVNVPRAADIEALSPEAVAGYLNRAGHFYTLGMRTFYLAVPLVFWFFGPYLLLAATVALVAAFYLLDRTPGPA